MSLYLRQLLAGRDFARTDSVASQMANFVYVIGDDQTRQCVIVDPAWDVKGILDYLDKEDMRLSGALVTHYHPDHIGGEIFGLSISGLAELLALRPVQVHVNQAEAEGVRSVTGISASDIVLHDAGDEVQVGDITIRLLHTPGHTPGSQCFLVGSTLVSGDTLFINGCGRVDLPGGNPEQMYVSLTQVLGRLPGDTILYPGHHYAPALQSTIAEEKRHNVFMRITDRTSWLGLMNQ